MTKSACLAVPVLCSVLLAPGTAAAQERGYYVRVAPGFTRTTVQHTKLVAIGQASSTSASSSTSPELDVRLSAGFRGRTGLTWFLGAEVEVIIYAPRTIQADIDPTSEDVPHAIQPGRWEFTNKRGTGVNFVLERLLGRFNRRTLLFAGVHRMQTEVASGGEHRGTGQFEEDRERRTRWPFTGGVGLTLGPIQTRVSYFRSLIYWGFRSPELEVDYKWRSSGVSVNVGVEVF